MEISRRNRGTIVVVCMATLSILATLVTKRCAEQRQQETLPMEATMASIEEVRLRGEMYVCSALIEDYTMMRAKEENIFWADDEHSCVQTMRQKCSYKIDMDKVEYQPADSGKTVLVKLPKVEYVATTESSSFLSDDGNYWADHLPNTNAMKRKVEGQIKRRFDTAENRRKAEIYAEDAISEVIRKLGYEVEFVRQLEKKKE